MIDETQSIAANPCKTHNAIPQLLLDRRTNFPVKKIVKTRILISDGGAGPRLSIGKKLLSTEFGRPAIALRELLISAMESLEFVMQSLRTADSHLVIRLVLANWETVERVETWFTGVHGPSEKKWGEDFSPVKLPDV
ncbi:hypothetical protein L6452_08927 [Arctium lappa]|uniref:Uncharacterized protein n=1 Tax=Arctium lappa TaxID=4217 RepID=A0ACB9DJF7_ARCLA|nr:hypothetical protein L6452_08927 [Arctium lappa]